MAGILTENSLASQQSPGELILSFNVLSEGIAMWQSNLLGSSSVHRGGGVGWGGGGGSEGLFPPPFELRILGISGSLSIFPFSFNIL